MCRKFFVCSAFNTGLLILVILTTSFTSLANLADVSSYRSAVANTLAEAPLFWQKAFYSGALLVLGLYHLCCF
jgi:hypothetical protein